MSSRSYTIDPFSDNYLLDSIECSSLWKFYGNNKPALRNVSYLFNSSSLYIIQGKNGSGKTSLLRILTGETVIDEGGISYIYKQVRNIEGNDKSRIVLTSKPSACFLTSYISKAGLYQDLSVIENLELLFSGISAQIDLRDQNINWYKQEIERLLTAFKLENYAQQTIGSLSRGYQQRASLARCFLDIPANFKPWVVLDEPSVFLDSEGIECLLNAIRERIDSGGTVILASHDNEILDSLSGIRILLEDGKLKDLEQK